MSDPFNRNHTPQVGTPVPLDELVSVVTAPNPSPMTFTGTQTYLIGTDSVAVIDPGPESDAHFDALIQAISGRTVSHIIVTHSHVDHSPLSRRLSLAVDAPILGYGTTDEGRSETMERLAMAADLGGAEGKDLDFAPDQKLADGAIIAGEGWSLEAIHTPGHLSNHLCFGVVGTGAVFSGDHVMGWATTMVSPPDGDLTSYMESMEKMAKRTEDTVYYPGHGAAVTNPAEMVQYQINHRKSREKQILETLENGDAATPIALAQAIYTDVDQRLIPAAARNVFAHLIDLSERNIVLSDRPISPDAKFRIK